MISVGRAGPADYGDSEGGIMVERLKKDLGIRAVLAIVLVVAAVGLVTVSMITGKNVPEAFMTMAGMVVQAYFMNRGTLDRPQ